MKDVIGIFGCLAILAFLIFYWWLVGVVVDYFFPAAPQIVKLGITILTLVLIGSLQSRIYVKN